MAVLQILRNAGIEENVGVGDAHYHWFLNLNLDWHLHLIPRAGSLAIYICLINWFTWDFSVWKTGTNFFFFIHYVGQGILADLLHNSQWAFGTCNFDWLLISYQERGRRFIPIEGGHMIKFNFNNNNCSLCQK